MDRIKIIEDNALARWNVLKESLHDNSSALRNFYDGAVLFATGGSGFLGKQLIEKLFRTCNVKRFYILLRPKKGKSIHERLKSLLDNPVFDLLRSEQPTFAGRIIAVEGDMAELKLGLNKNDWTKLANEVNVIFHAAAAVHFEETIRTSTLVNVRGTREMLSLARDCKQLKAVVHVSTAYVNATKNNVKEDVLEEFYDCPLQPESLIELAEGVEVEKLNNLIKPITSKWPNNYTLTKAVAEELLRKTAQDLPVCIIRPTIVISAYCEPSPGWVDIFNAYGPSGIILGATTGVSHTLLATNEIKIDFVPVDIVNNATIAAAWETHARYRNKDRDITIYTVTSTRNPLLFGEMYHVLTTDVRQIVTPHTLWYCFAIQTRAKWLYLILTWLLHYIPGFIIDGYLILIGQKPRFSDLYKKVYALVIVFEFFTNNEWNFIDRNTVKLYNKLSNIDKQLYNFDMASIDVKEMIFIWAYGVRKFIIRDGLKNTEYAVKKQFWLRIAHYICTPIYLYTLYKIICVCFIMIYNIFNLLI